MNRFFSQISYIFTFLIQQIEKHLVFKILFDIDLVKNSNFYSMPMIQVNFHMISHFLNYACK